MSREENKAIVRRYIETFNSRNTDALDEILSEDFIDHQLPPDRPRGPEGPKQWYRMAFSAFPDCHITIDDLIAEGDKVATRFTLTGTHQGDFMGVPATGKSISVTGMSVGRIAENHLVEWWENFDVMAMMQQLGAISGPGE